MAHEEALHLFAERGHRRHEPGLAGGCERHGDVQRHDLYFAGAGRTRWTGSCERDRVRVLLGIPGRLRHLPRLGCGRGYQQSV